MSLDQRAVLRRRTYDGINGRWSPWTTLFSRGDDDTPSRYELIFPDGKSKLSVETNTLSVNEQDTLAEELRSCGYFRQYSMRGSPEPRLQFLLHKQATENFNDPQPGYKYARGIRLKSRPLQNLKQVHDLSDRLERAYQNEMFYIRGQPAGWNIGVHCVLYRNGRDHMGYHADDDQGESLIVAVIVCCPRGSFRRVHIRPADRDRVGPQHDDVEIMLHLQAGDSYAMNGEMQKHYVHGVPSDARSMGEPAAVDAQVDLSQNQRMAIVFRRGLFKKQKIDSGQAVESLAPRIIVPYIIGGSNVMPQMREGYIYIRSELCSCHAHRAHQKGVSGNKNVGADSIIVSGLRPDGLGADNLLEHIYAASVKEGALALLRSAKDGKPVRVVRSNVLDSAYKATRNERRKSSSPQFYRYDGVYKITKVQYRDPRCGLRDYVDGVTGTPTTRVFLFRMERCGDGMGPSDNKIPNADYAQFCIDRGSMSHDALTALAQALPLEFQLSLNIFNQEFLGALSLLSLHPSTEVESLIYPGLQLLSNCAESVEVESLLCPGLQLLSNCAESTEVESLLCPGLQLLSNNRVTNRKRRHAALQEAALLEPIDGALNHASPVEAAQKRPAVLEPVINKAEPFHAARKVAFANFDMNESSFTTSAKAARCKGRPVNGKHHRAALQAPAFRKLRDRVLNHVLPLDIARKRPAMLEQAIAKADPLKVVRNASSTNSLINEGKKRRRLDLSANAPIQNEAAQGQDSSARRSPRFAMPLVNSTAAAKETVPDSCSAKQRHRPQEFAIGGKRTSPRLAKVVEIVRKARPARKLQNARREENALEQTFKATVNMF